VFEFWRELLWRYIEILENPAFGLTRPNGRLEHEGGAINTDPYVVYPLLDKNLELFCIQVNEALSSILS
jgi:hypothetical protein